MHTSSARTFHATLVAGLAAAVVGVAVALLPRLASQGVLASLLGAFASALLVLASAVLLARRPLAWLLVYAVAFVLSPAYSFGNVPITLTDLLAIGAVAIVPFRLRQPPLVLVAGGAWILAMLLSLVPELLAANHYAILNLLRALRIVEALLPLALLATDINLSISHRVPLVVLLLLAVGVSSGIGMYMLGVTFGPAAAQYIYLPGNAIHRAVGLYGEASTYGDISAVAVLAGTLSLANRPTRPQVVASLLAMLAGVIGLFLAYSRSSFIFLFAALAVAIFVGRMRLRTLVLLATALPLLTVAVVLFQPVIFLAFVEQRLGLGPFASIADLSTGRLHSWSLLLGQLANTPSAWVTGIGYKRLSNDPSNPFGLSLSDNDYLTSMIETGILGLATLVFWLGATLHRAYRSRPSVWRSATLAMFVGLTVESLTVDAFTFNRVLGLAVIALIAAASPSTTVTFQP